MNTKLELTEEQIKTLLCCLGVASVEDPMLTKRSTDLIVNISEQMSTFKDDDDEFGA